MSYVLIRLYPNKMNDGYTPKTVGIVCAQDRRAKPQWYSTVLTTICFLPVVADTVHYKN